MTLYTIETLTEAHWQKLSQVGAALVSFDERFEQPEAEFALLDALESLKLIRSYYDEKYRYVLYYQLTDLGAEKLKEYQSKNNSE